MRDGVNKKQETSFSVKSNIIVNPAVLDLIYLLFGM